MPLRLPPSSTLFTFMAGWTDTTTGASGQSSSVGFVTVTVIAAAQCANPHRATMLTLLQFRHTKAVIGVDCRTAKLGFQAFSTQLLGKRKHRTARASARQAQ